jgi:hypothetical protein
MEIDIGPVRQMLQHGSAVIYGRQFFCDYDGKTPQRVIPSGRHSGHIGYVSLLLPV